MRNGTDALNEIYPGTRVLVYFHRGFIDDRTTLYRTLMKPATVVQRYGRKSAYLPISETQPHEYPDLVDVVFDHEPDRVSHGHFTHGVELLTTPATHENGAENIAP